MSILEDMPEDEFRIHAGRSIQTWAQLLTTRLSPDDAWRLMLAGCLAVLLPLAGPEATASTMRELADNIERGEQERALN